MWTPYWPLGLGLVWLLFGVAYVIMAEVEPDPWEE